MLGIFSITQTPFDLAVVAAVLAVVGYSLNDTVVVFDRIRERFEKSRRLPPEVALDQAINQTLSRTIMTKVVTSIVVAGAAVPRGPGAARALGGAAHRHHRRHVFVDLDLFGGGARLRSHGRARVPQREEVAGRSPAVTAPPGARCA